MPFNSWNWYRAVGTGNDHKCWIGDNPQIEDGRDGGNVGFDDENRGQYEDECQHMMTRIKLNYYRAEEEMLIMERIRWRREREERRRLWRKTEKELEKLRKNQEWRARRERERMEGGAVSVSLAVQQTLRHQLQCPVCNVWLLPPIYQCEDGHVVCRSCYELPVVKDCPECSGPFVGRNTVVENIANIAFCRPPDTDFAHANLQSVCAEETLIMNK